MIARKGMWRAKVRFGLLIGAIALLVFLILFQQALRDGLITSFVGAIEHQDAPAVALKMEGAAHPHDPGAPRRCQAHPRPGAAVSPATSPPIMAQK